jgi:signal peptidase I
MNPNDTPPEKSPQTPLLDPTEKARTTKKTARRPKTKPFQRFWKKHQMLKGFLSFFGFVVSVVVLASLINMFIFQSYYVDGTSMTPTLQPNDRLIIDKVPRTWAKVTGSSYTPKRGEVVVFNSNLTGPDGSREQLIKRVVGLPGERVVVKDDHVTVYNTTHPKGFDADKELDLHLAGTFGVNDVTVPKDQVFVFGDNRGPGGSYDSRELGTIPTKDLVGQLVMRIIPLNHAKLF